MNAAFSDSGYSYKLLDEDDPCDVSESSLLETEVSGVFKRELDGDFDSPAVELEHPASKRSGIATIANFALISVTIIKCDGC